MGKLGVEATQQILAREQPGEISLSGLRLDFTAYVNGVVSKLTLSQKMELFGILTKDLGVQMVEANRPYGQATLRAGNILIHNALHLTELLDPDR
jgi:hypothetical protein